MSKELERRTVLRRAWQGGAVLIGAAGAWTTWDLLQPLPTTGFGGTVRAVPEDSVPEDSVLEVRAARAYLTRIDGDVVAISEKCTHLGCRVPWCDSSKQFECPCHGSVFNRAGERRAGPAPRGMDRYPVEIGGDGLVYIDTGSKIEGPPSGSKETIDEPPAGSSCAAEGA
ncbi:MAG: Rieske (2Fe-2S) protein [Acidimicrobiales bacterium]|nr:Rieske (2Fe-2S) protein [Acidimicrobiales bacterium]